MGRIYLKKVAEFFEDKTAGDRVDDALADLEAQFTKKLEAIQLAVTQLSEIAADAGTITAGDLTIDSLDFNGPVDITASGRTMVSLDGLGVLRLNALVVEGDPAIGSPGTPWWTKLKQAAGIGTEAGIEIGGSLKMPDFPTEELTVSDAGTVGATNDAWIEVDIGGSTYYIRLHTTK